MRDERSKQGQINKAKQQSTPKAVTFPKKNELPWVGLEPTTLYTLDRALSWLGMYMYVNFHVPGFLGGAEYVAAVSPDPLVIGVVHVPELSSHLQSITMHIMYVHVQYIQFPSEN